MLEILRLLFDRLDGARVRFIVWKSTPSLDAALAGETDLDILVDPAGNAAFLEVLDSLGFREAGRDGGLPGPDVSHHFGLDVQTGRIAHLHVYHRLTTGGTYVKPYRLPIHELLLSSARRRRGVPIPSRSAELVLFVVRRLLEHTSPIEIVRMLRGYERMRRELEGLLHDTDDGVPVDLLRYLPEVDPRWLEAGIESLRAKRRVLTRVRLGRRLARALHPYRIYSGSQIAFYALWQAAMLTGRAIRRPRYRGMRMEEGRVIAFVGPDASGKSTLIDAVQAWLEREFTVWTVHAIHVPPAPWTAAPRFLLPLLRLLLPGWRTSALQAAEERNGAGRTGLPAGIIRAIRRVWIASDRRYQAERMHRAARAGLVVLSDRYPPVPSSAPDGPGATNGERHEPLPVRWLGGVERRISQAPPADLVIRLDLPLEAALQRNEHRTQPEPVDYVTRRHAEFPRLQFAAKRVLTLDATRPFANNLALTKQAIWDLL